MTGAPIMQIANCRTTWIAAMYFLLTSFVAADPPTTGKKPSQIANRIFVPNAGYADLSFKAHLARRVAERGVGMFSPGQPLSVTGTRAVPVICVSFKNIAAPFPASEYERMLFGPNNPNSLTQYYSDISLGRLAVAGRVAGWYEAPKNDSYYENGNNGDGLPFGELLEFALKQADQDLDFGQFDNNGPDGIPNSGDDDGKVDTVFLIHPEFGAECDSGSNIWSHSWHYSEPSYGHTGPFETKAIRRDSSGHETGEKIVIEDYTIQPGAACGSGPGHQQMVEVGVFCHEFGHALGLPDFYDRTPNGNSDSEGIGNWCLMAGGSYGGDGKHSLRPSRMGAWSTYYLGWSNLETLTLNDETLELDAASERNDMKRLIVPNTSGLEYFLVEYRKNGPGVGGKTNWDEFLPVSGLAVWHIDERVGAGSPNWPFTALNQGQNDSPVRVNQVPPPLFKSKHPMVALVQADGKMHMEGKENRGDAGDLFVSGIALKDDPSGRSGSRGYDGKPSGISIGEIAVTPNGVTGKTTASAGSPPQVAVSAPTVPLQAEGEAIAKQLQTVKTKVAPVVETEQGDVYQSKISIESTMNVLDPQDIMAVKNASAASIHIAMPTNSAEAVRRVSARLRTKEIESTTDTHTPIEAAAKNLLMKSDNPGTAVVMYRQDGIRVSQLNGLRIMPIRPSPGLDSQERLKEDADIIRVVGENAKFKQITTDSTNRRQVFQQVRDVGGEQLPVWKATVALTYDDDDHLVSVDADTVSVEGSVDSPQVTLENGEALAIVADAVGLPQESLKWDGKGIYARQADSNGSVTQRIAYRITGNVSGSRTPLSIYLDAQTKKVLEIR